MFAVVLWPGPSSCFVFRVFYIIFLYCLHLTHHFSTLKWYLFENTDSEAGEMAQGVPALPQSSTPGTLIRWLTTASDFKDLWSLLWFHRHPHVSYSHIVHIIHVTYSTHKSNQNQIKFNKHWIKEEDQKTSPYSYVATQVLEIILKAFSFSLITFKRTSRNSSWRKAREKQWRTWGERKN